VGQLSRDLGIDVDGSANRVLDVRRWAKLGEYITVQMLDDAMAATGTSIAPGMAVLIRTGQERFAMTSPILQGYGGSKHSQ